MPPARSGPGSTWPRPTSGCAIHSSIASVTPSIITRGTGGVFIQCMTLRIASATTSKASATRFARSSSRCIGLSTIGFWRIPFCRELYIERDDFMEAPPPKYFRLRPGGEVRLKYAYIIKCDEVVKDTRGNVSELRCTADLDSKTGGPTAGRRVKGTIHWVSA